MELAMTLRDDRDPEKLAKLLRNEYAPTDAQSMTIARNKVNSFEWADGDGTARGLQRYIRTLQRKLGRCEAGPVPDMSVRDRLYMIAPSSYHISLGPLVGVMTTTSANAFDAMVVWESAFGDSGQQADRNVEPKDHPSALTSTQETRRGQKLKFVCWNCGQPDHKSFECPRAPTTCARCNRTGHLQRFCKKGSGKTTPGRHATERGGQDGNRGTYFALHATDRRDENVGDAAGDDTWLAGRQGGSNNPTPYGNGLMTRAGDKDHSNKVMLVDSGASRHMSSNREWFKDLRLVSDEHVRIANGSTMQVVGVGTIDFCVKDRDGQDVVLALQDAHYVPSLQSNINLFSTGAAVRKGASRRPDIDAAPNEPEHTSD